VPKRFVPAKLHGFLDWMTLGLFLTGAGVFRIKDAPASTTPSQVMGGALAIYCLLTDYGSDKPYGGIRVLSMKQHLQLDAVFATWVGLSPWVFGTYRKGWNYWAPQMLAMSTELFFALTTELDPD
jgi:hypothetical protein